MDGLHYIQTITMTSHKPWGVSNHCQLGCSFQSLLRLTTYKISKFHIIDPLWGEIPLRWILLTKGQQRKDFTRFYWFNDVSFM